MICEQKINKIKNFFLLNELRESVGAAIHTTARERVNPIALQVLCMSLPLECITNTSYTISLGPLTQMHVFIKYDF